MLSREYEFAGNVEVNDIVDDFAKGKARKPEVYLSTLL